MTPHNTSSNVNTNSSQTSVTEIRQKIKTLQSRADDAYLSNDIESTISYINSIFTLKQEIDKINKG